MVLPKIDNIILLDLTAFQETMNEDLTFFRQEHAVFLHSQRKLNITLDHVKAYFKTLKDVELENTMLMYGIV